VELLINAEVGPKLSLTGLARALLDKSRLPRIKDRTKNAVLLPLESYSLSHLARDHFAIKLIFQPIVQKDTRSFNLQQVRQNLDKSWEIELNIIVQPNILRDKEKT